MITAWVLYYDLDLGRHFFEERDGVNFASTDPGSWALGPQHQIILVLQKPQHLGAWLEGDRV